MTDGKYLLEVITLSVFPFSSSVDMSSECFTPLCICLVDPSHRVFQCPLSAVKRRAEKDLLLSRRIFIFNESLPAAQMQLPIIFGDLVIY